jgi:hypothetical protein
MTPRVVLGKRGTEYGIWVTPPGFNAQTALDSVMVMQMSTSIDQTIIIGAVSSTQLVPLGLNARPMVLLTVKGSHPSLGNVSMNPGLAGFNNTSGSNVAVEAASMLVSCSQLTSYIVMRRAF